MDFKKRLRQMRLNKNLRQEDLAKKINVTRNTVTAYESGRREPSLEKIKKISEILDCSVDYLIGASDVKNKADSDYVIYYDKEEEKRLKVSDLVKIYKMIKEFPK